MEEKEPLPSPFPAETKNKDRGWKVEREPRAKERDTTIHKITRTKKKEGEKFSAG